jgi:hypothetical protein
MPKKKNRRARHRKKARQVLAPSSTLKHSSRLVIYCKAILRVATYVISKLFQILENPLVLGVLLLIFGALVLLYWWVLFIFAILILLGIHRSGAIEQSWNWVWKMTIYLSLASLVVLAMFWLRKTLIEQIAQHPYLHIDRVDLSVKRQNGFPYAIGALIHGHNLSASESTYLFPIVRAAIIVRPTIRNASEESALFTKPGEWLGSGYVAINRTLNPQEGFQFYKEEPFPIEWNGLEPFANVKKLQDGSWSIYVVTKAEYSDRWGTRPPMTSCSVFIPTDPSLDNFMRSQCLGMYQP